MNLWPARCSCTIRLSLFDFEAVPPIELKQHPQNKEVFIMEKTVSLAALLDAYYRSFAR